jgi:hypothetical protein
MVTKASIQWLMAAVAVCTILAHADPSQAVSMISVTPNVPFRIVPEGDSGLFNFTVTNVGTEPVTLTVFSPLLNVPAGDPAFGNTNPIVNGVEFVSGDRNDEVFRTTIPNGEDFCGGFRLGPEGTCVFKQLFDTHDLNKSQSDTKSGIWKIYNFVSFTPAVRSEEPQLKFSILGPLHNFLNLPRFSFSRPVWQD